MSIAAAAMEPPPPPFEVASAQSSPDDALLAAACATAAAQTAAAASKSPPVVDPDLPGWVVIQRTTQTGRSYKVYHGPRGEYAESRRQALLLASGQPLTPAQLAPKSKRATLPVIEGAPAPSKAAVQAAAAAAAAANAARSSSQTYLSRGGNANKGKPILGSFHAHGNLAPLPLDGSTVSLGPTRALQRALARATSDSKWCVVLHPADVIYDGDLILLAIASTEEQQPLVAAFAPGSACGPQGDCEASGGAGASGMGPAAGCVDPRVAGSAAACVPALGHAPAQFGQAGGPAADVNRSTVNSEVTAAVNTSTLKSEGTAPVPQGSATGSGGGSHACALGSQPTCPQGAVPSGRAAHGTSPAWSVLPAHACISAGREVGGLEAVQRVDGTSGSVAAGEASVYAAGVKRDWLGDGLALAEDVRRRRQRIDGEGAALHARDTEGGHLRDTEGGRAGDAEARVGVPMAGGVQVAAAGRASAGEAFSALGHSQEATRMLPQTAQGLGSDGAILEGKQAGAHGSLDSSLHSSVHGIAHGRAPVSFHSNGTGRDKTAVYARSAAAAEPSCGGGHTCGGLWEGVRQPQRRGLDTEDRAGGLRVRGDDTPPLDNSRRLGSQFRDTWPREGAAPLQLGAGKARTDGAHGSGAWGGRGGISSAQDARLSARSWSAQSGLGGGGDGELPDAGDESERGSAGQSPLQSPGRSAGESVGDFEGEADVENPLEPGVGEEADDAEMRDAWGSASARGRACSNIDSGGASGEWEAGMETGDEEDHGSEDGESGEYEGDQPAGMRAQVGLRLPPSVSRPSVAPGGYSVCSLSASHFHHRSASDARMMPGGAAATAGAASASPALSFTLDHPCAMRLSRADSGGESTELLDASGSVDKEGLPTTILGAGKGKAARRRHEVRRSPYTPFKTRVGDEYQSDVTPLDPTDAAERDDLLVFEPSRSSLHALKLFLRMAAAEWPPSADALDRRAVADYTLHAAAQEAALAALHSNNYDARAALAEIAALDPPASRASWTDAQCLAFDSTLLSHGKEFNVIAKAVGCPVGAVVRRYYERKCRTDLCQGPPAMLAARPVSIFSLLADQKEATASSLASQRASALAHHSQQAAAAMAVAASSRMTGGGLAGHVARVPTSHRPTVWQAAGEIVSHSTGVMVSPVFCGPASSLALRSALGLTP